MVLRGSPDRINEMAAMARVGYRFEVPDHETDEQREHRELQMHAARAGLANHARRLGFTVTTVMPKLALRENVVRPVARAREAGSRATTRRTSTSAHGPPGRRSSGDDDPHEPPDPPPLAAGGWRPV
jgi:hypothetical protein